MIKETSAMFLLQNKKTQKTDAILDMMGERWLHKSKDETIWKYTKKDEEKSKKAKQKWLSKK